MNRAANRSLKKELTVYFTLAAVVTVISYSYLLISFFDRGSDSTIKISVAIAAKTFAKEYENNPDIAVQSLTTDYYLDTLDKSQSKYGDLLTNIQLKPGELDIVEPTEEDEDNYYFYAIYCHLLHDGRLLYVVSNLDSELLSHQDFKLIDDSEKLLIFTSVTYLLLAFLALWLYSSRMNKRTQRLSNWVNQLNTGNLEHKRPNFGYSEYQQIADCIERSLRQNVALMEREKRFLSHASHELRTPIAVIRANIDILERMTVAPEVATSLQRIDRSSTNMQLMVETLLWLNRKNGQQPQLSPLILHQSIHQMMQDLSYLINDENIRTELVCDKAITVSLPAVPFSIVLNNLIRNAYQYTHEGWIVCRANKGSVEIENYDVAVSQDNHDISFGLGLELTKQICEKLSWTLEIHEQQGGVLARLQLPVTQ